MLGLVLMTVLGLVGGSFLTAFVDRLHDGRNFMTGRSTCDSCKKKLGFWDLIPLFSWLALKGRCRRCKKKISCHYPLIESVSAAIFVLFYVLWPYSFSGLELVLLAGYLVILVGLLALVIYDLKWWLLPNKIIYPLMGWALLLLGVRVLIEGQADILLVALWSFLAGGGPFYLLFQVSEKHIGGGDVKLGFLLGLILIDWRLSLMTLFLSGLIGTAVVLPFMLKQKKGSSGLQTKLPFGPFLIVSALIAFWFGGPLIDWYIIFARGG